MIKTLSRDQIINAVNEVKNGQFCSVTYKSDVPLAAKFKKEGWKIVKLTETVGRLGVDYDHISSVKDRRAAMIAPAKKVTNNYTWVIENKIAYNEKTNGEYLRITTVKNAKSNKKFLVIDPKGVETEISDLKSSTYKNLPIGSYWSPKPSSEVRNIKLENVIKIGKVGRGIAF